MEFIIGIFGMLVGALLLVSAIFSLAGVQEGEIDPATPVILSVLGALQIATAVIVITDRM